MVATKISDPRELFLHELGDVLTAEKTIVKMLPKLQKEAKDKQLAQGLEKHLKQTRDHVSNVEKAFKALGERPKPETCPGIEGIRTEHDTFMKQSRPTPEMVDVVLAGAATRTEHYEIAVYEGLVTMAKALGETEAARLLDQNLKQDKEMLKEAQANAKRLAKSTKQLMKRAAGDARPAGRRRTARARSSTRGRK